MQRTRHAWVGASAAFLFALRGAGLYGCSLEQPLEVVERTRQAFEAPPDLGPPQRVFARRFVSPIRDAPNPEAPRLGYLRAGAVLHSTTTEPVGRDGCEAGWYELDTGGYVCNQRDVVIFSGERLPELRGRQPDRDAALPYEYATVARTTPLYKRIPSPEEVYDPPEDVSADAGVEDVPVEPVEIANPLVARILQPGFYIALDRRFEREDGSYWRTQQNGFVAEDRLRHKPWSEFQGQLLDGDRWTLPVAITRTDDATLFRITERGRLRSTREHLPMRTWLPVEGRRRVDGQSFLAIDEERLVRESDALLIEATAPPKGVGEGERWIDVDLAHQTLIAYDWKQPRYVTRVSTGRVRTPSPEIDYLTPRGLHRIRAKHLTATMDNDEPGEPPYSLEDVPYVMYFEGAYAFHSAFWHDRFGRPRSHGCINLAPKDAKWLYNWAGPDLPDTWHGGSATEENPGTWVWIHGETPGSRARK